MPFPIDLFTTALSNPLLNEFLSLSLLYFSFFLSLSFLLLIFFNFAFFPSLTCFLSFPALSCFFLLLPFFLLFLSLSLLSLSLPPLCLAFISSSLSASLSVVDQTVEAAKLPEARADRGAALSDLPPSPERQTNADMPISCKKTIMHHLYQLCVYLN